MKKYSINNSYFKQAYGSPNMPVTLARIHEFLTEKGELPFTGIEPHENWAYEAMIQRQKRTGVNFSQFLTPDFTAQRIGEICKDFFFGCDIETTSDKVLDACIGTGQLAKQLIEKGFEVVGLDVCPDMHTYCNAIGIETEFCSFENYNQTHKYVVSNPPYEYLIPFFEFLDRVLPKNGIAVLLLPNNTFEKKAKKLVNLVNKFLLLFSENMQEKFAHNPLQATIFVLRKK